MARVGTIEAERTPEMPRIRPLLRWPGLPGTSDLLPLDGGPINSVTWHALCPPDHLTELPFPDSKSDSIIQRNQCIIAEFMPATAPGFRADKRQQRLGRRTLNRTVVGSSPTGLITAIT
jgi:hypothetical protein